MTVALLEGRSVENAALLGTAAGAAAALNPGTGVCARADILRIYEALKADGMAIERIAR
jgi:6-phosphofructokinase 2